MFKKLGLLILVMIMFLSTSGSFATQICLKRGSYVITKKDRDVFVITMEESFAKSVAKRRIQLTGTSLNEKITANACNVFFTRTLPDKKAEIYSFNPSNGWGLRSITHTKKVDELNPVINWWGDLAFEIRTEDGHSQVGTSYSTGYRYETVADGSSPAWDGHSSLTYTMPDGWIYIITAKGQEHTYLPDGSGVLVRDGDKFTMYQHGLLPSEFATGPKSVAFAPYDPGGRNLAVVVNTDGLLEFWFLDNQWMPTGTVIPGPALSGLSYATWIKVP